MIKRSPEKYGKYAGGVAGGPRNPLGSLSERSRYLLSDSWHDGAVDDRTSVSNGCVRMLNEHVADLYERVPIGTTDVVL
jgi:lipoprotein-anchoring transpeptidase ErfK/SrfK